MSDPRAWGEATPWDRPWGYPLPDCLDGFAQLVARDVMPWGQAWFLLRQHAKPHSWHQTCHLRDTLRFTIWQHDCRRFDATHAVRKALAPVLHEGGDAQARKAACLAADTAHDLSPSELAAISREETAWWIRLHAQLDEAA